MHIPDRPQAGDVLASRPTARADEFAIGIVAGTRRSRATRYPAAIQTVRDLSRELRVDGWFTCDHTHYAPVARYRKRQDDT